MFWSVYLAIQDHLPYLLEEKLRKVCKVFSKLKLVKMNESHCFVSAFNQLKGHRWEVRVVCFKNELKYLCYRVQVLLIEIWQLLLTKDRLYNVQDWTYNTKASWDKVLVSTVGFSCLNAIISLSEQMDWEVFYDIVHFTVQGVRAEHISVLLAYLSHCLKGVADDVRVLGLVKVAYKFL